MHIVHRTLLTSAFLVGGAATFSATAAHASVAVQVTPAGACNMGNGTGDLFFTIKNAQGADYHLVATADDASLVDETASVPSQDFRLDTPSVANGTPLEATLTINGQDYHYGPIVLSEVDGTCEEARPAVHDIHASIDFLCNEGEPTINVVIENDGDYTEPLSGMFVDESFDTELGAGMKTNGQKVVTPGASYEYSVKSGQTTLVEDKGTMPDVCAPPATTDEQASAGQLPETGSSHTPELVAGGLLLVLGATLLRLTTRRAAMVWVEADDAV